jgi:hypothetical protein
LGGTAGHRRGSSFGIGQRLEGRPTDFTHVYRHRLAATDVNPSRLGWQPLGNDRAHQPFKQAAFLTTKHGFKFPTLVRTRSLIQVKACFAISAKEIAWPFCRKDHLRTANVDAVNLTLFNVVENCASTPSLVGFRYRPKPTWTHHLATTELDHLSRHIPSHELASFI